MNARYLRYVLLGMAVAQFTTAARAALRPLPRDPSKNSFGEEIDCRVVQFIGDKDREIAELKAEKAREIEYQ